MSKTWKWLIKNKHKKTEEQEVIDKAMENAITPEIELAIAKATKPELSYFTFLRRYVPIIGVIALLLAFVIVDTKLEAHFGEDNWDSMLDDASAEEKETVTDLRTVLTIVAIMILVMVGFDFYGSFSHRRYEKRIKKRIIEKNEGKA